MSDPGISSSTGGPEEPPLTDDEAKDPDKIKADIAVTRAQLAETADALAAKLDVKSQAGAKVHELGDKASGAYESAKQSAPEPVQKVVGRAEQAAQPVVAKASEDKKRTALIVGGVVVALLVVRRLRRKRGQ